MIDDPEKTGRLIDVMVASLPFETRLSESVIRACQEKSPGQTIPARCNVVSIYYTGDEGGILCGLDFGDSGTNVAYVSITHLIFDRKVSMFRQVDAYQRHRIKKLKQRALRGDGSSLEATQP